MREAPVLRETPGLIGRNAYSRRVEDGCRISGNARRP